MQCAPGEVTALSKLIRTSLYFNMNEKGKHDSRPADRISFGLQGIDIMFWAPWDFYNSILEARWRNTTSTEEYLLQELNGLHDAIVVCVADRRGREL